MSVPLLLGCFVLAAGAVWAAGGALSRTVDVLSRRLHLGSALGGLILLAVATNLPEIAITVSAALQRHLDIAIGNLLGGIGVQTLVLVLLDFATRRERLPLSARAGSLEPVLEGALVLGVLAVTIMGTQLPAGLVWHGLAAGGTAVALLWVAGVWLLGRARGGLPWQAKELDDGALDGERPGGQPPQKSLPQGGNSSGGDRSATSTARAALVFGGAALVTLVGGVVLEGAGEALAGHFGLSGVLFGATVLAAATALPEISTGLGALRAGNEGLAISDIFGGNAFLPVLFLPAALLSGTAVLPQAKAPDLYLAALGGLLTAAYLYGLVFRPRRRVLGLGLDSLVVVALYLIGLGGLVLLTRG